MTDAPLTCWRDRVAGVLLRLVDAVAVVDLNPTIRVLLLNNADELAKPEGEQDPDIAELACVYERLTGWTVQKELADHPNPWGLA